MVAWLVTLYSADFRAREINNGRIDMFAAIRRMSAGLYTMCWLVAIFRS